MNLSKLIDQYIRQINPRQVSKYEAFLEKHFGDLAHYTQREENDNLAFYQDDVKIFSIRLDDAGQYRHIDFFKEDVTRPYRRVYIEGTGNIYRSRFWQLGTWDVLYDVFTDQTFTPVLTERTSTLDEQKYVWFGEKEGQYVTADELGEKLEKLVKQV